MEKGIVQCRELNDHLHNRADEQTYCHCAHAPLSSKYQSADHHRGVEGGGSEGGRGESFE